MKVAKITSVYPIYLKKFYESTPCAPRSLSSELKATFLADYFGWADFWQKALRPFGYEIEEIIANNRWIQYSWAAENGIKFDRADWIREIVRQQILAIRPEVLFLDDFQTFSYTWINDLREACSSIRLVIGWCGAPFYDISVFKAYDIVLSNIPELVDSFRREGCSSYYLQHAFAPEVLASLVSSSRKIHPLTFIGQVSRGTHYHEERAKLLERISEKYALEIFSPAGDWRITDDLKLILKNSIVAGVNGIKTFPKGLQTLASLPWLGTRLLRLRSGVSQSHLKLQPFLKAGVFGLKMYQTLMDSQITLNQHIDLSVSSASNMRLFEASGVGACLLTDRKANLPSLFKEGTEIVSYTDHNDCLEKIAWLLNHPAQAREIGLLGQKRTLAEHTFAHRAPILDSIIRKSL